MKTAICKLESASPYAQSKYHQTPKLDGELYDDYEKRTWRERMHITQDGNVFIPALQFKNCISDAAKYLSEKIPGKGSSTWTKKFESGILVPDPITLPNKKDEVEGVWMHVPPDGKRGGSKRVMKCFGVIPSWKGEIAVYILDEIITEDVFRRTLEAAGKFRGVGMWRPANNGTFGRFSVLEIAWG